MSLPQVAIVGMGGYAGHHRSALQRAVDAGLAVHAAQVAPPPDHEPFADELSRLAASGTRLYDSLRELLAAERGRLDLVCVPTGIPLHRVMTVAVLEAGCNVLVEKPAAGSIQDVDAMIRTRDASGAKALVGYQHLFRRSSHELKQWLLEGRFGRLLRVRGFGCWPRPPAYYARNAWAGELAFGDTWVLDGPHNNALAHSVNYMCFLAGAAAGVSARPASIRSELYRAKPIATADTVALRVATAEGVEVFFVVSHSTEENLQPGFAIDTDAAVIEMGFYGPATVHYKDGRADEQILTDENEAEARSVEGAIAHVTGDATVPVCSLEMARAQTLCACGSFESAPIRDLPTALHTDGPDGAIAIDGMTAAVCGAFDGAQLFSELGLDWAASGDEIDLTDYRYFPTFRDPTRTTA